MLLNFFQGADLHVFCHVPLPPPPPSQSTGFGLAFGSAPAGPAMVFGSAPRMNHQLMQQQCAAPRMKQISKVFEKPIIRKVFPETWIWESIVDEK